MKYIWGIVFLLNFAFLYPSFSDILNQIPIHQYELLDELIERLKNGETVISPIEACGIDETDETHNDASAHFADGVNTNYALAQFQLVCVYSSSFDKPTPIIDELRDRVSSVYNSVYNHELTEICFQELYEALSPEQIENHTFMHEFKSQEQKVVKDCVSQKVDSVVDGITEQFIINNPTSEEILRLVLTRPL